MRDLTVYPAFVATAISIVELSRITLTNHNKEQPRTLSELAAAEQRVLSRFRGILLFCGMLFAITIFGFLLPKSTHFVPALMLGILTVGGELLAGIIPARGKTMRFHEAAAQSMALGMLGLVFLFWVELSGVYSRLESIFAILMSMLVLVTFIDKKRFIFYELSFIFLSHFSILVATLTYL